MFQRKAQENRLEALFGKIQISAHYNEVLPRIDEANEKGDQRQ
jgi:hypothetical protein